MNKKRIDRNTIKETTTTFMCTAEEKAEIQKKAYEKGITISAFCRMVLKDFMKKSDN